MRTKPKQSLKGKEILHNLVGCGATKLWSKYAVRKDAANPDRIVFL